MKYVGLDEAQPCFERVKDEKEEVRNGICPCGCTCLTLKRTNWKRASACLNVAIFPPLFFLALKSIWHHWKCTNIRPGKSVRKGSIPMNSLHRIAWTPLSLFFSAPLLSPWGNAKQARTFGWILGAFSPQMDPQRNWNRSSWFHGKKHLYWNDQDDPNQWPTAVIGCLSFVHK